MTHPLTPREKPLEQVAYEGWAQGLPGCEWGNQTETQKRAWSKATDAILTTLASGSGDHAELVLMANAALEIYSDDVLVVGGTRRIHADNIILYVKNGVEFLLAENTALRAEHVHLVEQKEGAEDALFNALSRATEAERKLAEAVGLLKRIDRTYADMQDGNGNHPTELRKVRTFLSKEAERG